MSKRSKKRQFKTSVKVSFTLLSLALILLAAGFFFKDNSFAQPDTKQPPVVKEPEKPKKVVTEASMMMVGDALIHGAVYQDASLGGGAYDFKPMIESLKNLNTSKKYDIKYYNQETILGGTELGLSTYPQFNSPYEVGDAFLDAGFNLVSLATNHTMDRGEKAILNSDAYWKKHKDKAFTAGSYTSFEERDQIRIQEVNGIKYAFFSYTMWNNGLKTPNGKEYLNNEYSPELAKADIERVRNEVDVVMVAMHWGIEYSHGVSTVQRETAEYLSSLGVDIIIGSHPHVVEPIEFIGKTMVVYSLGNSISAQIGVERLTGLIAGITIRKTVEDGNTTIELINPTANLIYTYYNRSIKNFKIYLYQELNDSILPGYKDYYKKFMDIVTNNNELIVPVGLE